MDAKPETNNSSGLNILTAYNKANLIDYINGYSELVACRELVRCHNSYIKTEDGVDCGCSDELGRQLLAVLTYVMQLPKYRKYKLRVRDEMQSFALYEALKNLHSFNIDKCNSRNPAYCFLRLCCERPLWKYLNRTRKQDLVRDGSSVELPDDDILAQETNYINVKDEAIYDMYEAELGDKYLISQTKKICHTNYKEA